MLIFSKKYPLADLLGDLINVRVSEKQAKRIGEILKKELSFPECEHEYAVVKSYGTTTVLGASYTNVFMCQKCAHIKSQQYF